MSWDVAAVNAGPGLSLGTTAPERRGEVWCTPPRDRKGGTAALPNICRHAGPGSEGTGRTWRETWSLHRRHDVEVQTEDHDGEPEVEDRQQHGDERRDHAPDEHGAEVGAITGHDALGTGGGSHCVRPADGRARHPDPGHGPKGQPAPVGHGFDGQGHHDTGGRGIAGHLGQGVGGHAPGHDGQGVIDADQGRDPAPEHRTGARGGQDLAQGHRGGPHEEDGDGEMLAQGLDGQDGLILGVAGGPEQHE